MAAACLYPKVSTAPFGSFSPVSSLGDVEVAASCGWWAWSRRCTSSSTPAASRAGVPTRFSWRLMRAAQCRGGGQGRGKTTPGTAIGLDLETYFFWLKSREFPLSPQKVELVQGGQRQPRLQVHSNMFFVLVFFVCPPLLIFAPSRFLAILFNLQPFNARCLQTKPYQTLNLHLNLSVSIISVRHRCYT